MDRVRQLDSTEDWALFSFLESAPTLEGTGSGGLAGLKAALDATKFQFALVRLFLEEEKGAIQTWGLLSICDLLGF